MMTQLSQDQLAGALPSQAQRQHEAPLLLMKNLAVVELQGIRSNCQTYLLLKFESKIAN